MHLALTPWGVVIVLLPRKPYGSSNGPKIRTKEGKENTQVLLIWSSPRRKEKSETSQVEEDGLNMLNKTSSLRSLSIGFADLACTGALLQEKDQFYQLISLGQNLQAFHFQFLHSHTPQRAPRWPLRMASTDRGDQNCSAPGNVPEAGLPNCLQTFSGPFTAALKFFKCPHALGATAGTSWEEFCREQVMMVFTPVITGG